MESFPYRRYSPAKANLLRKAITINAVEPLGQMILPCKLCLHVSNHASYYSSGIVIEVLSP